MLRLLLNGVGAQFLFRFDDASSGGIIRMYVYAEEGTGGSNRDCPSSDPIPLNEWTHVVGTYDGTTVKVYVNSEEVCSRSFELYAFTPQRTSLVRIGAINATEQYFVGYIDNPQVYDRALSSAQVRKLYVQGALNKDLTIK